MSTANESIYASQKILNFYTEKINHFGNSSLGVGWKDDQAQVVRFTQLLRVIEGNRNFSINDLGCGTGRLYKYMLSENYLPDHYHGYDILNEMIQLAEASLLPDPLVSLSKIQSAADMTMADYTVASGIFNVKYEAPESEWQKHILFTIELMSKNSRFGFAFNMLTQYSDKELVQPYLYYADPLFLFDFCKKNYSKNVALLHDYFQYDFTIIVRKQQRK